MDNLDRTDNALWDQVPDAPCSHVPIGFRDSIALAEPLWPLFNVLCPPCCFEHAQLCCVFRPPPTRTRMTRVIGAVGFVVGCASGLGFVYSGVPTLNEQYVLGIE